MGRIFTIGPGSIEADHIADEYKDGAADVPSLRTLGTGAEQAAAGDHTHAGGGLSDGDYGDVLVGGSGTTMTVQSLSGVAFGTAATTAATDYQPADSDLTAIAGLSSNGLVERTGSGTAAIRVLGVGASSSVPTRADADTRYAAASHSHSSGDVSGLAAIATSGSASDLGSGTVAAGRMPALTGDVTTSAGAVATTIAADAVTDGKLRNSAALSVIGRSANSTGDPADIAAGSDGDVLRRSGTSLGFGAIPEASVTNLTTDLAAKAPLASPTFTGTPIAPSLTFNTATPSAPSAGQVIVFGKDVGGRQMLAMRGPTDTLVAVQPHIGATKRCEWIVVGNTVAAPTAVGMGAPATTGTATQRNVAAGSVFAAGKRVGYVSSASAGQSAGIRLSVLQFLIGDVAGAGGFHLVCRFGVSDAATVANSRMFVGFTASTSAIGNVEPSSLTSIIGVGCDAGETNLSIIHNDGSGTATKVSLGGGSNFPTQTLSTDVYQLELYCAPNASTVDYRVTRLNTGHTAGGTLSSDLPANTALLAPQLWRNNGSTALAVGIDIFGLYIESDL